MAIDPATQTVIVRAVERLRDEARRLPGDGLTVTLRRQITADVCGELLRRIDRLSAELAAGREGGGR